MREIKFRGKRIDNGKWVYGYYIRFETRQVCIMGDDKLEEDEIIHLIARDGFADWNMPRRAEFRQIDPKTVGEYICLNDKQNNEIYEGDIVSATDYSPRYYQIAFIEGGFCLTRPDLEGFPIDINTMYPSIGCQIEVVGNVFDNPELLIK